MSDLVERLREASRGRTEWRVISPDGKGLVMWFSQHGPDAVLNPERAAQQWLQAHQRDWPERFAGYTAQEAIMQSPADKLMAEAAAEIERLRAEVEGRR